MLNMGEFQAIRIQDENTAAGADPYFTLTVAVKAQDAVANQAVSLLIAGSELGYAEVLFTDPVQANRGCRPDIPVPVFGQSDNGGLDQSALRGRHVPGESLKGIPVKPVQAAPGSYPKESFLILQDAQNRVLRKAFLNSDIFGCNILDPEILPLTGTNSP